MEGRLLNEGRETSVVFRESNEALTITISGLFYNAVKVYFSYFVDYGWKFTRECWNDFE